MDEDQVNLLDTSRVLRRDPELDIFLAQGGAEVAAIATGQGNDSHAAFVCGHAGAGDVFGVTGGGDCQQDVTGLTQCANLF